MLKFAEARAAMPQFSCVTCGQALTSAQAWTSSSVRRVGGVSYYCVDDAPADALPVVPTAGWSARR